MCPDNCCSKGKACKYTHAHGVSQIAIEVYDSSGGNGDTETSTLAEVGTDSSGEGSTTTKGQNPKSANYKSMSEHQLPSILAPRNPNVPEDQPKSKIEQDRAAADGPYKRYFERPSRKSAD